MSQLDWKSDVLSSESVLSDGLLRFRNCRLLRDGALVEADLWVKNGRILNPERVFFDWKTAADVQVDCGGALVSPGFIDIQVNGAFGCDFSSPGPDFAEKLLAARKGFYSHGVTAFCPTVISASPDTYAQVLPHLERKSGDASGAAMLGTHLEGPFIAREKHGCHPVEHIATDLRKLDEVYGSFLPSAALVTLAPELEGAEAAISALRSRGPAVSLGHSKADLTTGEAAVRAGASCITHLFNAMLPFHHRDPGLVGLLTSAKLGGRPLYYGVIADGIHTHDAALRIAHRTHPEGLILVTDAVAALGLGDGLHQLGDLRIRCEGHLATLADEGGTLAGSVSSLDYCVQHFRKATDCGIVHALEAATLHPAQVLGIESEHGTLGFGSQADFLLLDPDTLALQATFQRGQRVYAAGVGL